MGKHGTAAAVYLGIGVGVAAWTAYLGQAQKPHWEGLSSNAGLSLVSIVVLWPVAAVFNVIA